MSTLFNCSTIVIGDQFSIDTMNSASSFESFNSSQDSSQESAPASLGTISYPTINTTVNLRALLFDPSTMNRDNFVTEEPFLKVIEEPVEKFRFRYKSEMMGTHGSILARSHERNRRKTYPSVQLCNYDRPAIVRCSLYTAHPYEKQRTPHTHRLIVRAENNMDKDDPHEVIVSQDNNYIAVFHGMGIIHTAKKNIVEELIKKKRSRLLEKLRVKNPKLTTLNTVQESKLRQDAEDESRKMNLNSVSLCFEAFYRDANNCLQQICDPVFSKPINNMKSALTGELKICRIDKHVSTCMGGEEVFILVEKVGKKNIKIKFFEVNEDDQEIWCDYGKFSELDVHHQYAIVFRTPPYRDLDIEKPVDVFLQLYRPTDGDCSEPIKFQYKPSEKIGRTRKRQRISNENLHSSDQNINLMNVINGTNGVMDIGSDLKNGNDGFLAEHTSLSELLNEENGLDSSEFREFMNNLSISEYMKTFDNHDLAFDGEKSPLSKDAVIEVKIKEENNPPEVKEEVSGDYDLLQMALKEVEVVLQEKLPSGVTATKIENIFNKKNVEGETALHAGVMCREKEALKLMLQVLEKGGQKHLVNTQNISNETPLHLAVLHKEPEFVKMLLVNGADPNFTNSDGNTAIHLAVKWCYNECLRELLDKNNYVHNEHKPKCNEKNNDGQTPLHLAAVKRNLSAVKSLVKSGANVNEPDSTFGRHVLMVAVEESDKEIVEYLVKETNVDVNLENFAGDTSLHYACVVNGGNAEICQLLIDAKADPMKANHEQRSRAMELPLAKPLEVTVKEEIESEDEFQLHIDDDDEDEDDDEDDEEEEDDEGNGQAKGCTSLDLAKDNQEILNILKKADQYMASTLQNESLGEVQIKDECPSPSEHSTVVDNGLFDEQTLTKLCSVLDASNSWTNLADLLDYTFLVPSIRTAISPSKLLFNYADLHGNVTVQHIRNFLEALDEKEAVEAIDLMLARQVANREDEQ
nr:relish [Gryllodes sigillatus]